MLKKIYKIIFVLCFVFFGQNVYADNKCASDELSRLKKLAEKVEFDYDYEKRIVTIDQSEKITYADFYITAYNLNPDLRVVIEKNIYTDNAIVFKDGDKTTVRKGPFYEGDKVVIKIQAYVDNDCSSKTLLTKTIRLPYYNKYHELAYCDKIRESDACSTKGYEWLCDIINSFKYCEELLEKKITEKDFNDEVTRINTEYEHIAYRDASKFITGDKQNNNFSKTMLITIGVIVIIVVIAVSLLIVKKKKKKRGIIWKKR